jgi:hypothetical protein
VRSTLIAAATAGILLVTVVLPAEYGVDPTGVGEVLGLTEMGRVKMELAREAEAAETVETALKAGQPDPRAASADSVVPASSVATARAWRDSMTVTLAPGAAVELKLVMRKDQKAEFKWQSEGAQVNYNTHGEPPNPPKGFLHSYAKGASTGEQGELVAAFDGTHGWFWRNRSSGSVQITLWTSGEYQELKRM